MSEFNGLVESKASKAEQLAEGKWNRFVKNLDSVDAAGCALVLENTARWMGDLDETVRAVNVGNFDRFASTGGATLS